MKKKYILVILLAVCSLQAIHAQVLRNMTPRYNNPSVRGNIVYVANNIITSSGGVTTDLPPGGSQTNNGKTGINIDIDNTTTNESVIGRENGYFNYKSKLINYNILATQTADNGIDINISLS